MSHFLLILVNLHLSIGTLQILFRLASLKPFGIIPQNNKARRILNNIQKLSEWKDPSIEIMKIDQIIEFMNNLQKWKPTLNNLKIFQNKLTKFVKSSTNKKEIATQLFLFSKI